EEVGLFLFQRGYFDHPEPGLVDIYLYKAFLIVAAEDELAEELDLPLILALSLKLVDIGSAQVLDALGELFLVEKDFIYAYQQLVCPIGIELAAEAVIGQV